MTPDDIAAHSPWLPEGGARGALAGAVENSDIARVQPRQQCHGSHIRATGLSGGGDQCGRPARRAETAASGAERRFDVVCCWDLLEQYDDRQDVVAMMARAVTSGGVFFYSVCGPVKGSRREPQGVLRRLGLSPQPPVGLGHEGARVARPNKAETRGLLYGVRDSAERPRHEAKGRCLSGQAVPSMTRLFWAKPLLSCL